MYLFGKEPKLTKIVQSMSYIEGNSNKDIGNINLLPFAMSVFFTAFTGGWYLYDMYLNSNEMKTKIQQLEGALEEIVVRQDIHADVLHEQDQRIREKKNYDETEELHEGVYQAWKGEYNYSHPELQVGFEMVVQIWREKVSTMGKNQEWLGWDESDDTSCTVRDFYLGNSNPEFEWEFTEKDSGKHLFVAETTDTFINGWDSTIKMKISVKTFDRSLLSRFISEESFEKNKTMNKVLKDCINEKRIKWSHVLVDV